MKITTDGDQMIVREGKHEVRVPFSGSSSLLSGGGRAAIKIACAMLEEKKAN